MRGENMSRFRKCKTYGPRSRNSLGTPRAYASRVLAQICDHFFGPSRRRGTSQLVYRTPWQGNPRVNIQEGRNGLAKAYQVRQVIKALEKLEQQLITKQ